MEGRKQCKYGRYRSFGAISALLCGVLCPIFAVAQQPITGTPSTTPRSIFEALSSSKPGEGRVIVFQPDEVRLRVGTVAAASDPILRGEGNIQLGMGYRIQAYTGNVRSSKTEAYARAAQIARTHPDLPCYITYKAPFWRLNVGDFPSHEEARKVASILKRDFPGFARELYIVRDRIRTTVN